MLVKCDSIDVYLSKEPSMKTVFWGIVKEFMDELKTNSTLQVDSIKTPLPLNKREKEQVKTVTPNNIFEFHNEMNGLQVVWEGKKIKTLRHTLHL